MRESQMHSVLFHCVGSAFGLGVLELEVRPEEVDEAEPNLKRNIWKYLASMRKTALIPKANEI